jgi:flagellar hook-length control protein FliK
MNIVSLTATAEATPKPMPATPGEETGSDSAFALLLAALSGALAAPSSSAQLLESVPTQEGPDVAQGAGLSAVGGMAIAPASAENASAPADVAAGSTSPPQKPPPFSLPPASAATALTLVAPANSAAVLPATEIMVSLPQDAQSALMLAATTPSTELEATGSANAGGPAMPSPSVAPDLLTSEGNTTHEVLRPMALPAAPQVTARLDAMGPARNAPGQQLASAVTNGAVLAQPSQPTDADVSADGAPTPPELPALSGSGPTRSRPAAEEPVMVRFGAMAVPADEASAPAAVSSDAAPVLPKAVSGEGKEHTSAATAEDAWDLAQRVLAERDRPIARARGAAEPLTRLEAPPRTDTSPPAAPPPAAVPLESGASLATRIEQSVPEPRPVQAPPHAVQAPERSSLEALPRDMVRSVRYMVTHEVSSMKLRLVPESLGEVRVEVIHRGAELSVRLHAVDPVVRDTLEAHAGHLRESLQREGLGVARVEVGTQDAAAQQGPGRGTGHAEESAARAYLRALRLDAELVTGTQEAARPPFRRMRAHAGALNVFV